MDASSFDFINIDTRSVCFLMILMLRLVAAVNVQNHASTKWSTYENEMTGESMSLEIRKLIQIGDDIDAENELDRFGTSVALSADGNVLAVGAKWNDGNGSSSGHVRIYEKNANGFWDQVGDDIDGEDACDESGTSIALSSDGSVLAVGAPQAGGVGSAWYPYGPGHVRIYQNVNGSWNQVGYDIDGKSIYDHFGGSVALSSDGSVLAVGGGEEADSLRAVRVYQNVDGSSWEQIGEVNGGNKFPNRFGQSVSLSDDGSVLAVGAPLNGFDANHSGFVRVFKNSNGSWDQIGDDIDEKNRGDNFGISVDLSADGNILAVGAPWNDESGNNSGHVSVHQNMNGSWVKVGDDIYGENSWDLFGQSVALSADGGVLAVGAYGNGGKGLYSGHVRVFQNANESWIQVGDAIEAENMGDEFGMSVALSANGNVLAVGAPHAGDYDGGHVRVYQNVNGSWGQVANSDSSGRIAHSANAFVLAVGTAALIYFD